MPMAVIEVTVKVRLHKDPPRTDPRNPPPPGALGPAISSVEAIFPGHNESLRVASAEVMERASKFIESQAALGDGPQASILDV